MSAAVLGPGRANMTQAQIAAAEIEYFNLKPDWFIILTSILIVLVTLCLGLRVYVRGFMIRAFGKDDWVLTTAYIVFLADCGIYLAIGILQKREGLIKIVTRLHMLAIASTVTYLGDQVFIKLALAYFFLRVVKEGWQKWVLKLSVSFYTLYTTIFIIVVIFACGLPTPAHYSSGKCIDWKTKLGPMNYVAAVLNAVVDWILTITPIFVVTKVNMSRREKISVSILMLLGLTGSIVSVIRIPYVAGIAPTKDLSFFWKAIPLSLCSIAENGIGIMAISLAALRPLYARIFEQARTRFGSSANGSRPAKQGTGYILNSTADSNPAHHHHHHHHYPGGQAMQSPVKTYDPRRGFAMPFQTPGGGAGNNGYVDMEKEGAGRLGGQDRGHPMVLILPDPRDDSDSSSGSDIRYGLQGRQTPSVASTQFPIQKG